MAHESTLFIVSKKRRSPFGKTGIGSPIGKALVFRTRAKARAYAKSKNAKTRSFAYSVTVAAWGPAT